MKLLRKRFRIDKKKHLFTQQLITLWDSFANGGNDGHEQRRESDRFT